MCLWVLMLRNIANKEVNGTCFLFLLGTFREHVTLVTSKIIIIKKKNFSKRCFSYFQQNDQWVFTLLLLSSGTTGENRVTDERMDVVMDLQHSNSPIPFVASVSLHTFLTVMRNQTGVTNKNPNTYIVASVQQSRLWNFLYLFFSQSFKACWWIIHFKPFHPSSHIKILVRTSQKWQEKKGCYKQMSHQNNLVSYICKNLGKVECSRCLFGPQRSLVWMQWSSTDPIWPLQSVAHLVLMQC